MDGCENEWMMDFRRPHSLFYIWWYIVRNKTEISVDCFVYDDGGVAKNYY